MGLACKRKSAPIGVLIVYVPLNLLYVISLGLILLFTGLKPALDPTPCTRPREIHLLAQWAYRVRGNQPH